MRIRNQSWLILCIACITGCRALGIPSQRFGDFTEASNVSMEQTPDEEVCVGCQDEEFTEPPPSDPFGFKKWWFDHLQAKKSPPWSRFHPVPARPVFMSETPVDYESSLEYGKFGAIETVPHAAQTATAIE